MGRNDFLKSDYKHEGDKREFLYGMISLELISSPSAWKRARGPFMFSKLHYNHIFKEARYSQNTLCSCLTYKGDRRGRLRDRYAVLDTRQSKDLLGAFMADLAL